MHRHEPGRANTLGQPGRSTPLRSVISRNAADPGQLSDVGVESVGRGVGAANFDRDSSGLRASLRLLYRYRYTQEVPSSMSRIRLTGPTCAVLDVLLDAKPDDDIWGLRICQLTGLGPGTVYPILERLERAGWVVGTMEEDAKPPGRPRRRLYQVTGLGRAEFAAALAARDLRRRRWTTAPLGGPA